MNGLWSLAATSFRRGLYGVWLAGDTPANQQLWIDGTLHRPSSVTNGPIPDHATRIGRARDFDGTQGSGQRYTYAVASAINRYQSGATEHTIAAWVRTGVQRSTNGSYIPRRIYTDDKADLNGYFSMGWDEWTGSDRYMRARIYTTVAFYNERSDRVNGAPPGSEGLVALQWGGNVLNCWWRGEPSDGLATSGAIATNPVTTNIYIGDRSDAARGFDGQISVLYLWNRRLTDGELYTLSADPMLPITIAAHKLTALVPSERQRPKILVKGP